MTRSETQGIRCLHWFRQDLRLSDNPALLEAAARGSVLPVYILDDENAGDARIGGAGRWWLDKSLSALNEALGGGLRCYRGRAEEILPDIIDRYGIEHVGWNRCYEPWRIARDKGIKAGLKARGISVHSHNGSLLWEPHEVLKADGTLYRVFTPFYRKGCLSARPPRKPLPAPGHIETITPDADDAGFSPDGLTLRADHPWAEQLDPHWQPGEVGARQRLEAFLSSGLSGYKDGRNRPAEAHVSRLSPHLHWGEVSPNQVWSAASHGYEGSDQDHFLSELGWREFSYALLYHEPSLVEKPLQHAFENFPWQEDSGLLKAWQRGQTGIPIVDAGMRELWQTGYMHNRVRMIVGSFLVKNLRLHWHHGRDWFWDTLVDSDLASNSASWQWIAGCGADAAPYFRVFNPVLQGEKFDTDGLYTRRFVPELEALPNKYLFKPWEAPSDVLNKAGLRLGVTYPYPVVDLKQSRNQALQAFQQMKEAPS
ncbi:cryptochrome/photolyase family protein [Coralliovum pocilloporae]|uniref:cryptochrome/photolyase family protein n=1 Tax=Coralliovum pocilloporae TaxID=3066369 RepID=UPI003306C4E3